MEAVPGGRVLGARCWVLGAGCSGAGCWVLGAGCSVLGAAALVSVTCYLLPVTCYLLPRLGPPDPNLLRRVVRRGDEGPDAAPVDLALDLDGGVPGGVGKD